MRKNIFFSQKKNKGFTLVETLVAIVILLLMTAGLTIGISAAAKTYKQITFTNNSETLRDTINTAFSDVLRYARNIEADGQHVYFSTNDYQAGVISGYVTLDSEGKLIIVNRDDRSIQNSLMNDKVYAGLHLENFTLTYTEADADANANAGTGGIFTGRYTITDKTGTYNKQGYFKYKVIN